MGLTHAHLARTKGLVFTVIAASVRFVVAMIRTLPTAQEPAAQIGPGSGEPQLHGADRFWTMTGGGRIRPPFIAKGFLGTWGRIRLRNRPHSEEACRFLRTIFFAFFVWETMGD